MKTDRGIISQPGMRMNVMDTHTYHITATACEKLKDLLTDAYPEEGCAILLGSRERYLIDEVLKTKNCAPQKDRKRFFSIDPGRLIEIERGAEEINKDLMGFAHSHPDAAPVPSEADKAHMIPQTLNVIMTTHIGGHGKMRAYISDLFCEDIYEVHIGITEE